MAGNVKKFAKKKFITAISIEMLNEFFQKFNGRIGLDLENLTHEAVYRFLTEGEDDCPPEITENLHLICDLASPEGADIIRDQTEKVKDADDSAEVVVFTDKEGNPADPTIQELAFFTFLRNRNIFDAAHDRYFCYNVKSPAEYIGIGEDNLDPTNERIDAFKTSMAEYFQKRYKGKYCEVKIYPDADEINIVIFHGKHLETDTFIIDEQPKPTRFRKQKQDMISYASVEGRLKVCAVTADERDDLATRFGECFFDDPDFFHGEDSQNLYTLEPLEESGADFVFEHEWDPEVKEVKMVEVQGLLGQKGAPGRKAFRSLTLKDFDCLATLKNFHAIDFKRNQINYVRFKFVFLVNGKEKRVTVKIKPPSLCNFERRMLEEQIMEHLRRNGFALERKPALASSAVD